MVRPLLLGLLLAGCASLAEVGPAEPMPPVRPEREGAFRVAGRVSPKEAHPYRELVQRLWPHAVVFGRRGYGEVLAQSVLVGWTRCRALAIVPQGSSHRTLSDLVGATVALVDPLFNTGRACFFRALRREGFQPERMLRRMVYTYSHDRAVEAVARGLVDVAAVDGMVLDALLRARLGWRNRIRVLEDLLQAGDPLLALGIVGFRLASGKPHVDLWREVSR
ncbi:phosphonate ABC transporter, periplasmic phosphonate-binding protein [Thermus thermophilus]|uniref:PhnD/SsuA/transferrin family substrate-binding protein n=1 Tax=Thermus thermophilus TaxID=274 RepID=UPI0009095ADD|nr:PhnD/SsuA/transferrin family substrate-binding protein [Thermus thermophilus]BAW02500.1 phosphonate ABC transporter, periplasmic phosphonate-binding protein [Thermus thermophilus]BDB10735.1 hypothetical protein TthTMY_04740 [Thermus thermophilus]